MHQLTQLFRTLSVRQRIGIALAALLAFGAITGLVKWKHERDFKPLFTGMAPEDAAAIIQKLKENSVEHRISDNGSSVSVPESKVDELRLEMAGAGLPKVGRIGFELFDKTNLGITDFTEHVNYRRALEGELERSIRALNEVDQARVHITFRKDSVFLDAKEPAKASVLLHLRPGVHVTNQNVQAITNLVASAVEGLAPESVSVLDMQGNLLNRARKSGSEDSEASNAYLEYKRQVEKDLTAKVDATLEPLLGEGHYRVGITADCDFTKTEESDEAFDPSKSVMVTSQKTEDLTGASQPLGVPGTASNLPRPASRPSTSGTTASRRSENISFETSRVVKNVKTPQGGLKRISAALLIDQDVRWEGKGAQVRRVLVPPTPEKLKSIHEVIAGVLGLVPDRGDQLVIETLPFEQTLVSEPPSPDGGMISEKPSKPSETLLADRRVWIGAGTGALVLIGAISFLFFKRPRPAAISVPAALPEAPQTLDDSLSESRQEATSTLEGTSKQIPLPAPAKKAEQLRTHLKETVKNDPAFAAGVLRTWLEDDRK